MLVAHPPKIQGKLSYWAFIFFELASRTVLLKAMLQSIPIYQLSAMETPKGACSKMVDIFNKFIIRKKVWKGGWWPKVTHFLWIVCKGWILTYDQLQKRGF